MQTIEELNDSLSNLIFNRKTIARNEGIRGVVFKETRQLFKKIDRTNRDPQWVQLLQLIDDKILEIELQIEQLENENNGEI
jgi:hypothetical protein